MSIMRLTATLVAALAKGGVERAEETVCSYLKKAQGKLGVRNRAQAVAEALRQQLIP